jgi:transcriptional regulator with XRE-family HTH domain
MTQEQLAQASELSAYFIGSIERGQATISVRSLEQVARALAIDLRDLFVFVEEQAGREELQREISDYIHAASVEELRALAAVCRTMRRPAALARG